MSGPRRQGLREAHAHIAALGEWLATPSLASCGSVAECLERVREERARGGSGGWVKLMSARIEGWREARWPTLAELDEASGGDSGPPCVIKSFDHHAGIANSAALRAAGLRGGDRVAPNGEVVADAAGNATGLLIEQAAWAAWEASPPPTQQTREGYVRAALQHLKSLGYTEIHDMFSQRWLGPMLTRMKAAGDMGVRVWMYAPVEEASAYAERRWERDEVRLAGLKAFADGTLNSRTALMTVAYEEPLSDLHGPAGSWRGKAMMTSAALDEAMATAAAMGLGLAVHAIGDGAVRMVLDGWEARGGGGSARARCGNGTPPLRIEHCELIDEADVPRFAAMGVTCSMQPCHLLSDVEALRRYLPHRLDRVLPARELMDAGCLPGELLWFGSDVPIVPADPMDSVRAATERRRPGASQADAIGWEQRISTDDAWRAFGAR